MTEDKCRRCHEVLTYAVDGETYSHEQGVKIPGVYDGVLMWRCPWCANLRHAWPEGSPLWTKALAHMNMEQV